MGKKRITSTALNKRAASATSTAIASSAGSKDEIDFDSSIDDNSSDEKEDVHDYSHEQQDVVLFSKLTVNKEPPRRHNKVASLQDKDRTALTSKATDETDISDASSDNSVINFELPTTGSSSTPAHLRFTAQETFYLEKGNNGALFYSQVKPVGDMMGEVYIAPPQSAGRVQLSYGPWKPLRNSPSVDRSRHVGNFYIWWLKISIRSQTYKL